MLLNLTIAVLILATVGGLVQWRVTRSGSFLRFHLADMLALITLIAVGLGVYAYHDTLRRQESPDGKPVAAPSFRSSEGWFTCAQSYQGPHWLRKLVGNPYYLPVLHHVDTVTIQVDARWRESFLQLRDYSYLKTIHPRHGLPQDAISILRDCSQLEEIYLGMYEFDTPLFVPGTKDRALQPDDFSQLKELHLKKVTVSGVFVQKQHIAQLAALPTMRHLLIQSTSATQEQIEELRREYPQVQFHELPDIRPFLSP